MKYKLTSLLLAIIIILSGCSVQNIGAQKYFLTTEQKQALAEYSYSVLDSYFNKSEKSDTNKLSDIDKNYYKIYITFLVDGAVRCSQSGTTDNSKSDKVARDIDAAIVSCIGDERFGGKTQKEELEKIKIVFDVLYNRQELNGYSIDKLESEVSLGVHALRVEKKEFSANFKSSVPISKNYTLEKTLENLCEKADLDKLCYTDQSVKKYKYDDISFIAPRGENIIDLYRCDSLINEDEITQSTIKNSIEGGYSWFKNDIDPKTNLLKYMYYPSRDEYTTKDNNVRRMAASWASTELMGYLNNDDLRPMVDTTIDHYMQYGKNNESGLYIDLGNDAKIAYNAFLIMALINSPNYPSRDQLQEKLADAIIGEQNEDGSYNTDFLAESSSGTDYYPGESMLALMKLYNATKNEKYINSVKKAFPYYKDYWRQNKNTAFIPWHTQTYKLLYDASTDKELVDFVFEMNDWIIAEEQQVDNNYPDFIGGFKKNPSNSTASYLEGLTDAYALAQKVGDNEHIDKYQKSVKLAARFVLQTQYTKRNVYYLKNPELAIGGFRQSLTNNQQRNDYTQHATLGLVKTYQIEIFK